MTPSLLPNPEVVSQRLDDGMVLVHMRTNRIFELSSTAARLWELLGSDVDVQAIHTMMLSEFEVDPGVLQRDIAATISMLKDHALISERPY